MQPWRVYTDLVARIGPPAAGAVRVLLLGLMVPACLYSQLPPITSQPLVKWGFDPKTQQNQTCGSPIRKLPRAPRAHEVPVLGDPSASPFSRPAWSGSASCRPSRQQDSWETQRSSDEASWVTSLHLPELEGINLGAGDQTRSATQSANSSTQKGSPGHIFWVFPAFNVNYQKKFQPLTPREKFDEWVRGVYDPEGLGVYVFEAATLEYSSSDGFCGYGKGWDGYGKCLGSMELDANISSFFGDFLFPVIMHQDPRYFRLGQGSFGARLFYAVSRVFVTHSDSGRWVFDSSALSGTVLAAAASNLYYPRQDRGFGPSLSRAGVDLGDTALFNVAAEFWPDIRHALGRAF
ncbi:MAG: hypothetical protein ACRD2B_00365 [Terriglobia bacterium]